MFNILFNNNVFKIPKYHYLKIFPDYEIQKSVTPDLK